MDKSILGRIQTTKIPTKIILALFVLSAVIATALPYGWARLNAGSMWQSVTPQMTYDAMYYFSRSNDVLRGNYFAKNPYFFEHKDGQISNPSLNDFVVALPRIFGFSFNFAYYANIFLWAFVFFWLIFTLLRAHSTAPLVSFIGALVCYFGLYSDMLRPGTMQIIYPLYILFLLLFWRYINNKNTSLLPLAIIAGISIYFYIFLFMLIATTLGVYALTLLFLRDWVGLRRILLLGVVAAGVALPQVIVMLHLSSLDFYHETMARISLYSSRWPQIEAYYYGRWVVLMLFLVYVLRRYHPDKPSTPMVFFIFITGTGILLAMVSNVITGKDFEIAVHIARFGILWYLLVCVSVAIPVIMFVLHSRGVILKRLIISLLFLLVLFQVFMNFSRQLPRFTAMKNKTIEVQTYRGVLDWLGSRPESVVVAPEDINSYIPTLINQYVLYNIYGANFVLSDDEIQERYLLYYGFNSLTLEDFIGPGSEYPFSVVPSNRARTLLLQHRLRSVFFSRKRLPTTTISTFIY